MCPEPIDPDLRPATLDWLGELLETAQRIIETGPIAEEARSELQALPELNDAVARYARLVLECAEGHDVGRELQTARNDLVWLFQQLNITTDDREEAELARGLPILVDRTSVPGLVGASGRTRAFVRDPFSEAVSSLSDLTPAVLGQIAADVVLSARRCEIAIDRCLAALNGVADSDGA